MVLVILKAVLLKLVLLYVRISLGLGFHEINKIFTLAKKKKKFKILPRNLWSNLAVRVGVPKKKKKNLAVRHCACNNYHSLL